MAAPLTSLGDLVASARSGGEPPVDGLATGDGAPSTSTSPWSTRPPCRGGGRPSSSAWHRAQPRWPTTRRATSWWRPTATTSRPSRQPSRSNPLASTSLTTLLRGAGGRAASEGLLLESAVYSSLQAGPEFAAWRAARPGQGALAGAAIECGSSATATSLHITLTRAGGPQRARHRRCAISSSRRFSSLASTTRSPRSTCAATGRRSARVETSMSSARGPIRPPRTSCGSCRAPGGRSTRSPIAGHGPRPRCLPGLRGGAAGVRGTSRREPGRHLRAPRGVSSG